MSSSTFAGYKAKGTTALLITNASRLLRGPFRPGDAVLRNDKEVIGNRVWKSPEVAIDSALHAVDEFSGPLRDGQEDVTSRRGHIEVATKLWSKSPVE